MRCLQLCAAFLLEFICCETGAISGLQQEPWVSRLCTERLLLVRSKRACPVRFLTSSCADAGPASASGTAEGNNEYNEWLNMLLTGAAPACQCDSLVYAHSETCPESVSLFVSLERLV